MKNELWKPVSGFNYEVSSFGRVKRDGHILKLLSLPKGYKYVILCKNGKKVHKYIHRLVAEAFIPNPEDKQEVNHKDGDKCNNNMLNLEWSTSSQNRKHAYNTLQVGHQELITFRGLSMNQRAWAKRLGVKPELISYRLRRGWSVEKTLTAPVRACGRNY